ncbi:response regulator [Rodentibacter caecimuris]|uniref:DNA-binding response regulator n=1 Tax=Rodentibacter caecimuris TaxID=1796644 RepID=A0ABX3KW84_9PAST|nr:DNA-binding response regulator [Rodentibacter heylii]
MSKILLVDDDMEITELLSQVLKLEGFDVEIAHNGKEALEKLNNSISLVLLDVMMPVLNGVETLKQVRRISDIPVMMLTARGEEIDRVLGLELGADDYLPKPFNDRELVARIKAILRRTNVASHSETHSDSNIIQFCGLELNLNKQQANYNDRDLELTASEFLLLHKLIECKGTIISRDQLSQDVLGKALTPFDRSIDMHMSNLRKKLPERSDNSPWFKTVRGRGYLLISD